MGQRGKKSKKRYNFRLIFFLLLFTFFDGFLSRDREVCHGIFAAALVPWRVMTKGQWDKKTFLSRDKGMAGQGNFFFPGQRDIPSRNVSIAKSLGNPTCVSNLSGRISYCAQEAVDRC